MTNAQLSPAPADGLASVTGEAYLLEQIGHARTRMLTVGAAGDEVIDDWAGAAASADPKAATVLYFDGPVSPAAYEAMMVAAQGRLQPALREAPGLIRTLALWNGTDRSVRVVHLAESVEALEAAARAVNASTLLPGEDPALLTGPDRSEVYRVVDTNRRGPR